LRGLVFMKCRGKQARSASYPACGVIIYFPASTRIVCQGEINVNETTMLSTGVIDITMPRFVFYGFDRV